MPNPFVHIELNTTDPNQAKQFYGALFNWELQDMNMGPSGTYTSIRVGDGTGGGILKHPMPGAPTLWIPYVVVDDLVAATNKAKSLGAKIIKENQNVPDMGAFSIITDPTGGTLGLWEERGRKT